MDVSAPSLHRESTDSLIGVWANLTHIKCHIPQLVVLMHVHPSLISEELLHIDKGTSIENTGMRLWNDIDK